MYNMNGEKKYKHLEVSNNLSATKASFGTLYAKELYLENTEFKSHLDVNNLKVKEVYESNNNTNAYTDEDKDYLSNLKNGFEVSDDVDIYSAENINLHGDKGTIFKLPSFVDYEDIPEGYGTWCIEPEIGLILKYKHKGKLMYHAAQSYEWNFPVDISVHNDNVSVRF